MRFYSNNDPKLLLLNELSRGNKIFRAALQTSALLLARSINNTTNEIASPFFAMYSLSDALDGIGTLLFNKTEAEILFCKNSKSIGTEAVTNFVNSFMHSFNRIRCPGIILLDRADKQHGKNNKHDPIQQNTRSTLMTMLQSSHWLKSKVHDDKVWLIQALVDSWFSPIRLTMISSEQSTGFNKY